jgi:hypothetical protein
MTLLLDDSRDNAFVGKFLYNKVVLHRHGWVFSDVTCVQVYSVQALDGLLRELVVETLSHSLGREY